MWKAWRNYPKSDRPSFKRREVLKDTNESCFMDKANILRFTPVVFQFSSPSSAATPTMRRKRTKNGRAAGSPECLVETLDFSRTLLLFLCYPIFCLLF